MSAIARNPDDTPVVEWNCPQPLVDVKQERGKYPLESLPAGILAAVNDVAATTQAPIAMVATSAICALSLAGQAHIDVERNSQLKGASSLFALIVAESGERKSTVDSKFTKPFFEYEKEQFELLKLEIMRHKAQLSAWEAKKNGMLLKIKTETKAGKPTDKLQADLERHEMQMPIAPKVPQLIMGDITPEALAFGLAKNYPTSGIISSESGVVFGSHGMGIDSAMRNLSTLNTLWDAGVLKINRKTSDSFSVSGARLAMCLQVQHPVLVDFVSKTGSLARGSGFLARFLVARPESTQGTRLYKEPDARLNGLGSFNARITTLLNQPLNLDKTGDGLEPVLLTLSHEAKTIWVKAYNAIETQLLPSGQLSDVKDVASKAADNAARIAALFHLFESGSGGNINKTHMESACRIAMWHLDESKSLLGELGQDPSLSDAAKLDKWLVNWCNDIDTSQVSVRDILRNAPARHMRNLKQLQPILDELIDADRARLIDEGKKKWIAVNPKLLRGS